MAPFYPVQEYESDADNDDDDNVPAIGEIYNELTAKSVINSTQTGENSVFQPEKVNFRSLKDHPDVLERLINTTVTKSQFDAGSIKLLTKFVDDYIDTSKLKANTFSKAVWGCEYETTSEYIQQIFKLSIDKEVTFGKLIQNIVQNTVMDEFSGFTIHDGRTSCEIPEEITQAISYMIEIKQKNMEYNIKKAFCDVDKGIMFLTEYDHNALVVDGLEFTQIQMCGNRSKAVASKNMTVEIIPYEEIQNEIIKRHNRTKYVIDCINDKDTQEMFSLLKVDNVYFLCVHLKSIGNKKAAKKNVALYITTKCVIDWLKELSVEFFTLGDFNIPFLHEDTYIGFDAKDASWHPIQEPPQEHCINYEMTRINPSHKDTLVHLKKRTSDCTKNAQGSIGKFYEDGREGITDFVFHYLPKTQYERDLCGSKYNETAWLSEYSPQDSTIECIPFVDDSVEKSFCSDHQMLVCRNGKMMVGTWNVLSSDCSPPAAYKKEMTATEIEKANDELAEIINNIYNTM